tara:strand:+ start:547 stop:1185 length:639 start_codon:yes stop_codon:yes gene_type:complete
MNTNLNSELTIGMIGCGKLGFPIAKNLISKNIKIFGTTTQSKQAEILKKYGISTFIYCAPKNLPSQILKTDKLLITLPFKKQFKDPLIYKYQILGICNQVENTTIKHIVFTSSSSIYPKDGKMYKPTDSFPINNARSKVLIECEELIQSIQNTTCTIIRLGGLVGEGRAVPPSAKYRRLCMQIDAINKIINSLLYDNTNQCINLYKIANPTL